MKRNCRGSLISKIGGSIQGLAFLTSLVLSPAARAAEPAFLDAPLARLDSPLGSDEIITLCKTSGHPCGIEESKFNDLQTTGKPVRLENLSPRAILDGFVQRHSAYEWTVRDGVINVEPKQRPSGDVLSRKLVTVSIHGATSLKAILDVLHQADVRFGYTPMSRKGRYAVVNVDLKNVTVREALNAIAKQDGELGWTFALAEGEYDGNLYVLTWKKNGTLFSDAEREKVKEWIGKKKSAN